MIREERDPGFWSAVINHPEVKPNVMLGEGSDLDVATIVTHPQALPLAAEHGGFIFVRLDGLGRVYELHSMFTPDGWGREVLLALKASVERVFSAGAQLIVTYEVEGNWRSRPPKTFRFEPCGDFAPALGHQLRTWSLSKSQWSASPARLRM